jgi:hypothetical protein
MSKPYEVGYGKPPRSGQFKKGSSGNPGGRRRGSKNINTMVEKALNERVSVNINGKAKRLTKIEAALIQQSNRAAGGDQKAMKLMVDLLKAAEARDAAQYGGDQTSVDAAGRERQQLIVEALKEQFAKGDPDDKAG